LLYQEAKIFWHAAGMNSDEETHPELAEHFGITTVEAMSAGCVPVVVNKGGQPEIVEHGVSGFVWNTPDELQEYTARLMKDEELWRRMSKAARLRAEKFSRQAFLARFQELMAPHTKLSFAAAATAEPAATH
jgi:glycosyltransferase involved in cell wall biosynthesis